jgi:hypothetical protein
VAQGPGLQWYEQAAMQWLFAGVVIAVAATVIAAVGGARVDALLARSAAILLTPSPRLFGACVALATTLATAALTWFAFHHQVFAGDEMATSRLTRPARCTHDWSRFSASAPHSCCSWARAK